MKAVYTLLLGLFLGSMSPALRAQNSPIKDLPKVIPPPPSVASLGKYGDVPIGFYNGLPNISLPLYTVTSRDVSIPISLSYHASGIKVSEEAGRVGLGWTLIAGGSISRNVMGADDFTPDINPNGKFYFSTPELPMGMLNQPPSLFQLGCSIPNIPDKYVEDGTEYDFEPDQFSYNFGGYSGKFILKRDRTVLLAKQEKIQIVPNAAGSSWTVKTPDGTSYLFDKTEVYYDWPVNGNSHYSAWYLSQVTSSSGEIVTLNYSAPQSYHVKTPGSYSERVYETNLTVATRNNFPGPLPDPSTSMGSTREYSSILLDNIDFGNGRVVFNYNDHTTNPRTDVEGDRRIESLRVYRKKANGTLEAAPFREFTLGYNYFSSLEDQDYFPFGKDSPYVTQRLKLISLTESATDGVTTVTKPYQFRYYEEGVLPAKTSLARDHWGYFNGRVGNTSLIPSFQPLLGTTDRVRAALGIQGNERDTNPTVIQQFSLKEIQYPTRGRTEFQYEAHDYDLSEAQIATPKPFTKSMFYNGSNRGQVFEQILDLTDEYKDISGQFAVTTVVASFRFTTGCSTIGGTPDVYFQLTELDGNPISTVAVSLAQCGATDYAPFTYTNTYILRPAKYRWRAFAATNVDSFNDISATYSYIGDVNATNTKYAYAGGLRISRIIDHDDLNEANNKIRRFIYRYSADKNNDGTPEQYSSGRLMALPQYSYFEKQFSLRVPQQGEPSYGPDIFPSRTVLLVRASDSNVPLNGSAGGSVVGYDQVTVRNGEEGEFGKTEYLYHNTSDRIFQYTQAANLSPAADYGTEVIVPVRPPALSTISHELNGMLKTQIDYANKNSTFTPVRRVENTYFATK